VITLVFWSEVWPDNKCTEVSLWLSQDHWPLHQSLKPTFIVWVKKKEVERTLSVLDTDHKYFFYLSKLYYKTADTAAEIFLPENIKIAKPGDNLKVRAKLHFPLTITKGARFALREGGKTVAAGVVTEILPEETVLDSGRHKKGKTAETPAATTTATDAKKPAETKPAAGKAGDKKAADKKDAPKDAKKDAPKATSPAGK